MKDTGNEKVYNDFISSLMLSRFRVGCMMAAVIMPLGIILDYFVRPEFAGPFFIIRIISVSFYLVLYAFSWTKYGRKFAFTLSMMLCLSIAAGIETAILKQGVNTSTHYAGLNLILIAAGLLFPLNTRQMALASVGILAVYLVPIAFSSEKLDMTIFANNNYFLFLTAVIAIVSSYYTSQLRKKGFQSQEALKAEKEKSENLLLNILPESIAVRLKDSEQIADSFAEATILFSDICEFTKISSQVSPEELIKFLNEVFSSFDVLAEKHGVEKIKTIGDAYMVVAGLPVPRTDHVEAIANMALDMQQFCLDYSIKNNLDLKVRIGINTGAVIAGVIGTKKFIYDLWGDAVNIASRMESHGMPGQIQVTEDVYEKLKNEYLFSERGFVEIKGKGAIKTYLLNSIGQRRA